MRPITVALMSATRKSLSQAMLRCIVASLVLLTACSTTTDDPGTAAPSSSSPAAFPSNNSPTGVVGTPFVAPSYSPYGFETCEPERIDMPEWVPSDLPLPEGTYATALRPATAGYEQGFFVIPGDTTLPDFTRLVVEEWPKSGYELGRGDSEAGEIESEFSKPPATGAFKVQATSCNPAYSVMLLIFA
ncbi:MAG: hypothetical protein QOI31_2098, partial [Solirubrobacterales bacterium]|nr:hypothetical protein [Solirubrobacterales bacterium]